MKIKKTSLPLLILLGVFLAGITMASEPQANTAKATPSEKKTAAPSMADDLSSTLKVYRDNPQVKPFFANSYAYAVFPAIGKGGFGVGGAYGKGQVYRQDKPIGRTRVVNFSIGWQAGGQAYSQMIFFQDKRAYDEFVSGEFSFDAQASAVAITAGVQAKAGTGGSTASATAGPKTAKQAPISYHKGMAVFVHSLGGLMVEAAIAGQRYGFTPF